MQNADTNLNYNKTKRHVNSRLLERLLVGVTACKLFKEAQMPCHDLDNWKIVSVTNQGSVTVKTR